MFDPSSEKHGVTHGDVVHAIYHASFNQVIEEDGSSRIRLFIGPQHPQTEREIEVLVREYPDTSRPARIFHAMLLGPKFRRLREEVSDGNSEER